MQTGIRLLAQETIFRKTYDKLTKLHTNTGYKIYLKILHLPRCMESALTHQKSNF